MDTIQIQVEFSKHGIYAMFGARKGNGFWLYQVGKENAISLVDCKITNFGKFFSEIMDQFPESPIIKNDGKRSGNPCFWMKKDAVKLLETL